MSELSNENNTNVLPLCLSPTFEKPLRLLLVEDSDFTRAGLKASLSKHPLIDVVGDAEDSETGIVFARDLKPDLIIMDLTLPGLDGIETTRRIRTFLPDVKVIVLTAHFDPKRIVASKSDGATGYCGKDIPPKEFSDIVLQVAKGAIWLDPHLTPLITSLFASESFASISNNNADEANYEDPYHLTAREMDVLTLLVKGQSNSDIANSLHISSHTAKAHVSRIMQKMLVTDRVQAAVKAVTEGLLTSIKSLKEEAPLQTESRSNVS